jgi:hypothetical protein
MFMDVYDCSGVLGDFTASRSNDNDLIISRIPGLGWNWNWNWNCSRISEESVMPAIISCVHDCSELLRRFEDLQECRRF